MSLRLPGCTNTHRTVRSRRRPPPRRGARVPVLAVLLLALLGPLVSVGALADTHYLLVLSNEGGPYGRFAEAFRAEASRDNRHAPTVRVAPTARLDAALQDLAGTDDSTLLVAVGVAAARNIAKRRLHRPILYTLLPRSTYKELLARYPPVSDTSALYIDQPFHRQLALAKLAVPGARRVGVLLGPTSGKSRARLLQAAEELGLELVVRQISQPAELIEHLSALLAQSDVFLAVPDPLVSNRRTAPNILLTTYRYRRPVIGYSRAYVEAGALCAVYSTPRQLGAQAYRVAARMLAAGGQRSLAPQYPRRFRIQFNDYVARSLELPIPDTNALIKRLHNRQETRP